MDNLDFLDGDAPAQTAAPIPEAPVETPVEQTAPPTEGQGQPRGPDGKFAPKEPEASAQPAPEPQAPAIAPVAAQPAADPNKAPEGYVPIGVVQELRKEIQALKQQPQQPQTQFRPGEEGYEEEQAIIAHESLIAGRARVQVARTYAVKTHGEDTVNQALEWASRRADSDQTFARESMAADDPVAFAIEEFEYHQALGKLRDPQARAAFMAALSGQAHAPSAAASAPAAPPQPAAPPPSITSAPSAGGAQSIPMGQQAIFDATIG